MYADDTEIYALFFWALVAIKRSTFILLDLMLDTKSFQGSYYIWYQVQILIIISESPFIST